jgi:hypothetical protein
MTPQQLAELLLGIARAQAAIVNGLENEFAGVRSARIIPRCRMSRTCTITPRRRSPTCRCACSWRRLAGRYPTPPR